MAAAALLAALGLFGARVREKARVRNSFAELPSLEGNTSPAPRDVNTAMLYLIQLVRQMDDRIHTLEDKVRRLSAEDGGDAPSSPGGVRIIWGRGSQPTADRPEAAGEALFRDQPKPRSAAREPAPSPLTRAPAQRAIPDDASLSQLANLPGVAQMLSDYNRAAAGDRDAATDFAQRYAPIGVVVSADGSELSRSSDDDLWFVPIPGDRDFGMIVPGSRPIKIWDRLLRGSGGLQAQEKFGRLFTYRPGDVLFVEQPAWGRRHSDSDLRVLHRGVISGVS